jgi:hypothetical protein
VPHITGRNKWDPQFGVESMGPLFYNGARSSAPTATSTPARRWASSTSSSPSSRWGHVTDLVMALWFAELGCREIYQRFKMPAFDERMKVPERIKRKRRVVDFGAQEIRRVPMHEQRGATHVGVGASGYRRLTVGRPSRHDEVDTDAFEPEAQPQYVNVPGSPVNEAE